MTALSCAGWEQHWQQDIWVATNTWPQHLLLLLMLMPLLPPALLMLMLVQVMQQNHQQQAKPEPPAAAAGGSGCTLSLLRAAPRCSCWGVMHGHQYQKPL